MVLVMSILRCRQFISLHKVLSVELIALTS